MRFNAQAVDPEFLALYDCRSGSAKWVQYCVPRADPEFLDILSYKVGRERENEAIPIVSHPIGLKNIVLCGRELRD